MKGLKLSSIINHITPTAPEEVHELADVHRASFSRGWNANEIERLVSKENVGAWTAHQSVKGLTGRTSQRIAGFVLTQIAADEAEILTIAIDPKARRSGAALELMKTAMRKLYEDRVASLFLEVDEANTAAITLYKKLGFKEVGSREGYYSSQDGSKSRALVMRVDLR